MHYTLRQGVNTTCAFFVLLSPLSAQTHTHTCTRTRTHTVAHAAPQLRVTLATQWCKQPQTVTLPSDVGLTGRKVLCLCDLFMACLHGNLVRASMSQSDEVEGDGDKQGSDTLFIRNLFCGVHNHHSVLFSRWVCITAQPPRSLVYLLHRMLKTVTQRKSGFRSQREEGSKPGNVTDRMRDEQRDIKRYTHTHTEQVRFVFPHLCLCRSVHIYFSEGSSRPNVYSWFLFWKFGIRSKRWSR